MSDENFTTLDDVVAELNKDPEFVRAGLRIAPHYDVAHELFVLRKEKGLSREDIAAKSGLSTGVVNKIDGGDNAYLGSILKYADALDAHIEIKVVPNN